MKGLFKLVIIIGILIAIFGVGTVKLFVNNSIDKIGRSVDTIKDNAHSSGLSDKIAGGLKDGIGKLIK